MHLLHRPQNLVPLTLNYQGTMLPLSGTMRYLDKVPSRTAASLANFEMSFAAG